MKKVLILLIIFLILPPIKTNFLIRSNYMYEKIIEGIHKYYNNTCILLIHAIKEPVEPKGESLIFFSVPKNTFFYFNSKIKKRQFFYQKFYFNYDQI